MNRQETKKRERERTPNNRTTEFRISDELWAVFQPLLPVHVNTHCFGGGRPRASHRDRAYAIFYVPLARDASAQAGTFLKLWQAGIEQFEELCGIERDWLSMDEAMRHPPRWAGNKPTPIRQTEARAG
jgi:hypothetical protein